MRHQRRMLREHERLNLRLDRLKVLAGSSRRALPDARMHPLLMSECTSLLRTLKRHFALEEKSGYMSEVYAARPELSRRLDELQAQHAGLRTRLTELTKRYARDTADVPAMKLAILELLERVTQHESRRRASSRSTCWTRPASRIDTRRALNDPRALAWRGTQPAALEASAAV